MTIEHPPSAARQLHSLEITRGLACAAVVLFHSFDSVLKARHIVVEGLPERLLYLGPAAVDVFFVISGFIMVYVTAADFGRPGAAGDFMARRAIRILPMYWIYTAGFAWILSKRASFPGGPDAVQYVASSFVLWPWWHPDGFPKAYPLLPQAWTLPFEAYFYALFAVFVRWGSVRTLTLALPIVFGSVVVLASLLPPSGPRAMLTNPVVFEFWLGIVLAAVYRSGWRPTARVRILLLAFAATGFVGFSPMATFSDLRSILWGVPAAALIAAVMHLAPGVSRVARGGMVLGSISYSWYLGHTLAIEAVARSIHKGHIEAPTPSVAATIFVLTLAGAALSYFLVERPLTRRLNGAWRRGRAAQDAVRREVPPAPAVLERPIEETSGPGV